MHQNIYCPVVNHRFYRTSAHRFNFCLRLPIPLPTKSFFTVLNAKTYDAHYPPRPCRPCLPRSCRQLFLLEVCGHHRSYKCYYVILCLRYFDFTVRDLSCNLVSDIYNTGKLRHLNFCGLQLEIKHY